MHRIKPSGAGETAKTDKEHLAASAYRRYQTALQAAGAMDFDDLLLCTEELLARHAEALRAEAERFTHLLIDEYQDTNHSQYAIVKALAQRHRNLCVVGDDDQSIYGWRGAEVSHILSFGRDWPEAKVVRLEQNYRCTAEIILAANRLIGFNRQRHAKVLRCDKPGEKPRILQAVDEIAEAENVVEEIQARIANTGAEPLISRSCFGPTSSRELLKSSCDERGCPTCSSAAMSFYDRKEVRDVLAYLKLLVQPARRDLAFANPQHAAPRHRARRRQIVGRRRGRPRPGGLGFDAKTSGAGGLTDVGRRGRRSTGRADPLPRSASQDGTARQCRASPDRWNRLPARAGQTVSEPGRAILALERGGRGCQCGRPIRATGAEANPRGISRRDAAVGP